MLSAILTWIGAMLGIAVLLAMAFGAFVLDFDDTRGRRSKKTADVPERPTPLA
ncbi:hypothetical protein B0I33_105475 [Prauserella shujinwangii]|uniref:Uncharacterized protein n=1 Tax=Prauserella shujinwangii TaxID=1453103 RepID=A0A2T0LVL2_9PSEU|nr:hypothetical protein [Prauserella shujinwangii]PRX47891.1 hypothetical protein B0I33_105475 [Prauserella shujinwangii]